MPLKPQRPCSRPGCRNLTRERFCTEHQADIRQYDRYRGSSYERGYNSEWRAYRVWYLQEHPICVECKRAGILEASTVVDHIIPHKGDQELFWRPSNHQALCTSCHSRKTAKEDGGFGNERKQ